MAPDLTYEQVGRALAHLGTYRVIAAQVAAAEGPPDGIGGHHMLVLGLRETLLQNINNPAQTDHGWSQISENYHLAWLHSQPGCKVTTWVAVPGHTADEDGYCPRFTPALHYSLEALKANKIYAEKQGVPERDSLRVAFNGYNRGIVGAIAAYKAPGDDIDAGTTGGDYGGWCLRHAVLVKKWLAAHDGWRPV